MNDPHIGIYAALSAPFEKDEVRTRNQAGRTLEYITARAAMNRLDEVLGPSNWWDAYEPMGQNAVICRLTIRLPDGTTLTKSDVGGCSNTQDASDSEKSGFSDAFKRAAVKFGVARYLYGEGIAPSVRAELARQRREQREQQGQQSAPREPGSDDDREPEPHQAPRQHQPHQQSNGHHGGNGGGYSGGDSAPRSGKALFAWIKKKEEEHGVKLLPVINGWGKDRGLGHKMVEWSGADVEAAHAEACEFLQHNGHAAGAAR